MDLVLIKYNAGNIQSVSFALDRLGISYELSDDPEKIRVAAKVIFPGVGEAGTTMRYLREHKLDKVIRELKQPFLGICLGMQLMCSHSEENDTECLGIFEQQVLRFNDSPALKVPHMGWNQLSLKNSWLDATLEGQSVYFVHSYYVPVNPLTSAITDYIVPFSSAMHRDNFYAVQFHPEKSAAAGELVLKSFLRL